MASDGLMRERYPAREPEPRPDIQLDPRDREDLLVAISAAYANASAARRLLRLIGFPSTAIPAWTEGTPPDSYWEQVFSQIEAGLVPEGYRQLLHEATTTYRGSVPLRQLHQRYIDDQTSRRSAGRDGATCHVFVRAETPEERDSAFEVLRGLNLDPREELSTELVTSYSVSSDDQHMVSTLLRNNGVPWTVASPDSAHYLFHTLMVQGPDGSRFRLRDTPAAETFGNIAAEVVATQYSGTDPQSIRPTVINQVRQDGQQERVTNPEQTLDEAGVQDGDQMSVAFEGRAGSIDPAEWEDALARVRGQITGFARSHGIRVVANAEMLPTRYDLTFTQPSFGPPGPDGEPTQVDVHTVRILLSQGFPVTAPLVFWLTPFFHPNVYPTYDCELTIGNPGAPRGQVCLGDLADSWFPAKDLAEVCRMIIDIAAYRNYDLFGLDAADPSAGGHLNFLDETAARWVLSHQAEIERMGGAPVIPVPRETARVFRTKIERLN